MRLLIITSYNKGAVAPFVADQVDALRRANVECDYYLVQGKGLLGYLRNRRPLLQKIATFQPDIIHAHYGLSGMLANLQRTIPVVTTFHGSDLQMRRNRWFSRMAYRLSAHSICVSTSLMRQLGTHPKHCSLLPCGVDTELFKPCDRQEARRQLQLPLDQSLVLFAGSFADPAKNVALAQAAMHHLPSVRLIEARGYTRIQMALLFNAVDLLLVTSHSEGSPQVVKEALACDCPVVSVDVGDVAERIAGIDGCSIVPRKSETIAAAIASVLRRDQRCMGRTSLLQQHLDNDSVVQQLQKVYHSILPHLSLDGMSDARRCIDLGCDTLSPRLVEQWDELYHQSSTATVFQSSAFFDFIKTLDCWEPFAYGVTEGDMLKGVVVGFIQREGSAVRRFFTRRAIVNGGPLLSDDISNEAVALLLESCSKHLFHCAIYIETRNLNDYSAYRHLFEKCRYRYQPHYNFILPLTADFDDRYHRSLQRNLHSREPLQACHNATLDEVRQFYQLLKELYHTRVHTPLFPLRFFEACHSSPLFHYTLVKDRQGHVVGGTLIVLTDMKTAHLWFAAGCRKGDRHAYPSEVAHDATLRYCQEHGLRFFDFMGAGRPNDGGYGVRVFKSRFGGTLVEHGRYLRILHPLLFAIGHTAVKVIKLKKPTANH